MYRVSMALLCYGWGAFAQTDADKWTDRWSVHFQATSVGQTHGAFRSLYEGENSLPPHRENRVSLTSTLFVNYKLTKNVELVGNPEIAGGKGFGMVTGIAGFPNGEIPRVAEATPTLYLARGYVRVTVPRDDGEKVTVVAGKFGLPDFFDNNRYSHDPRTQFLNWSLMYNGAWDYPADVRGYTIGVYGEYARKSWTVRAATALEPTEANGPKLDTRVGRNRGEVVELERRHVVMGRPGAVRVLGYANQDGGGTFREALALGGADLGPTRRNGALKYGWGVNVEQEIAGGVGVFGRYGWSDGKTESWAFTQIDRSLSGGVSVNGAYWGRRGDHVGVGMVRNELSGDQRSFLAAGGMGFIVGDGRLNYGAEKGLEAYYSCRVTGMVWISGDYQRFGNPGYNRDRGPVGVFTVRVHLEK